METVEQANLPIYANMKNNIQQYKSFNKSLMSIFKKKTSSLHHCNTMSILITRSRGWHNIILIKTCWIGSE